MGLKILLIDDEELIRKVISFNLGRAGYEVISCSSGPIGVVKIKEVFPDLVILDRFMPIMDGYQVTEVIRHDVEIKDIPVMMLTASNPTFEDIKKAHELGIIGYIKKSSDISNLLERLEDFFNKEKVRFHDKTGLLAFYQRTNGAVIIIPFYIPQTIPRLEETINYLNSKNLVNIVLDLSRVNNIDDIFLEAVSNFRNLMLVKGGDIKLYLTNIPHTLEIYLNSHSLPYCKSLKEALDSFVVNLNIDNLNLDGSGA